MDIAHFPAWLERTGLTPAEVAQQLDISLSTVKSLAAGCGDVPASELRAVEIAMARERLGFAQAAVAGAHHAAELGDLLPGNGPIKIATRIERAEVNLAAAEAALARLLN